MSGFDEYAADQLAGMQAGIADVGRAAYTDIADSYQQVLMGHASITPADGLTGTMETTSYQVEPVQDPVPLEPYPEPPAPTPGIDVDMG